MTSAWALIARQSAKPGTASGSLSRLGKARRVERHEQARAREIVGDDAGDVGAELRVAAAE